MDKSEIDGISIYNIDTDTQKSHKNEVKILKEE